jgi:hypothetical protein
MMRCNVVCTWTVSWIDCASHRLMLSRGTAIAATISAMKHHCCNKYSHCIKHCIISATTKHRWCMLLTPSCKSTSDNNISIHMSHVSSISSSMYVTHHALLALGSCAMPSITAPKPLLTSMNRALSAGSCLHMSSLAIKMLSKYIHLRCTVNIISTTSPMQPRAASQASTCGSNDSANRKLFAETNISGRCCYAVLYVISANACALHGACKHLYSSSSSCIVAEWCDAVLTEDVLIAPAASMQIRTAHRQHYTVYCTKS